MDFTWVGELHENFFGYGLVASIILGLCIIPVILVIFSNLDIGEIIPIGLGTVLGGFLLTALWIIILPFLILISPALIVSVFKKKKEKEPVDLSPDFDPLAKIKKQGGVDQYP